MKRTFEHFDAQSGSSSETLTPKMMSKSNLEQPDCVTNMAAAAPCRQRNGEAASSSPESGSLNGDSKRGGKNRRRKKRVSNPEGEGEEAAAAAMAALQAERGGVWMERGAYERAESLYQSWLAGSAHSNGAGSHSGPPCRRGNQAARQNPGRQAGRVSAAAPESLDLAPSPPAAPATTPDEGYHSQAPTPATPTVRRVAAAAPPINGLPRVPLELLGGVWLEKPLYDRAEAAFYQKLHANNSSKGAGRGGGGDRPHQLLEEEEGEEPENKEKGAEPQQEKAYHALHPIQEEEEEGAEPEAAARHFLHPDSERVWLEKWRYDAAESGFHGNRAAVRKGRRSGADAPATAAAAAAATPPPRDKNMSSVDFLSREKIWFEKPRYDEAERRFYERGDGSPPTPQQDAGSNSILQDIARARENIQKSLAGLKTSLSSRGFAPPPQGHQPQRQSGGGCAADQGELVCRIKSLELENQSLHQVVSSLRAELSQLECRVAALERSPAAPVAQNLTNGTSVQQKSNVAVKEDKDEDEDDDIDLFGSDEDEEADRVREQRLKEYAEKKAKKPGVIAKSSILLDVKPWDDETDMARLEECVRSVQADGLLWGTSKLVPVGYGIKKLQIACVVEDDKVGTDLLEEEITKFEDYVQSVDVAAFNKI